MVMDLDVSGHQADQTTPSVLKSAPPGLKEFMQPIATSTVYPLLSLQPSHPRISTFLQSLSPSSPPTPQTKSYPEAQYHAFLPLGLDLIYAPTATEGSWELDRIDIYNPIPGVILPQAGTSRRRAPPQYKPPSLPISIQLARIPVVPPAGDPGNTPRSEEGIPGRPEPFLINTETTGRDFVAGLGEPSRKGGAQGWVGPWLEWTNLRILIPGSKDNGEVEVGIGFMVELKPTHREPNEVERKKGMGGVWDQAASWEWGCIKFFRVGSTI